MKQKTKNKTKAMQYVFNIIVAAILYLASVAVLAIFTSCTNRTYVPN